VNKYLHTVASVGFYSHFLRGSIVPELLLKFQLYLYILSRLAFKYSTFFTEGVFLCSVGLGDVFAMDIELYLRYK